MKSAVKKPRVDGQMTGLAGEFFVAAELLRLGLQTSVTFGNAKSIDLLAHCAETDRNFAVQVKALRYKNWFLLNRDRVVASHIYVFVILNEPGSAVQYFIVPGADLLANFDLFGKGFDDLNMPGVYPTSLASYANRWDVFLAVARKCVRLASGQDAILGRRPGSATSSCSANLLNFSNE